MTDLQWGNTLKTSAAVAYAQISGKIITNAIFLVLKFDSNIYAVNVQFYSMFWQKHFQKLVLFFARSEVCLHLDQNVFENLLSVLRRRKKSIFEKLLLRFVCLLVDQNVLKILISVLREREKS